MYNNIEPLNGGLGGGYFYQWLSALYVGSIICSRSLDANFKHPFLDFLSESFDFDTDLSIKLEGRDPESEDFELQSTQTNTNSRWGRVLFQVKTFPTEKSSKISLTDRTIVSALKRLAYTLIKGADKEDLKTVLILNAPLSSAPGLSRFRPAPLSTFPRHKLAPLLKKLPFSEEKLDNYLPLINIWQLPEFDFLCDYLWLLTGMDTRNVQASLSNAGVASARQHGSTMALHALCKTIQQRANKQAPRREIEQQISRSFLLDYTLNNPLPNDDLSSYLKHCYVIRKDNNTLDDIQKNEFFLHDIIAFCKEATKWTDDLDLPAINSTDLHAWQAKLGELQSLVAGFDTYGVDVQPFLYDYDRKWQSLRDFFLNKIHDDSVISRKIVDHKRNLYDAVSKQRNIILIIGKAGSGKTLTALRFAEAYKAEWKLYLNLAGKIANLETITSYFASKMHLHSSPFLFSYLRTMAGKGLVLVDGVDEADAVDDNILLLLLKSLARVLPYDCVVLLTCRWDYIQAFTSSSNFPSDSEQLLRFLKEDASLIKVPRIDTKDPAPWLTKLSKCYGIPQNISARLAYLVGRRYTPREINWLMITIQQDLVSNSSLPVKRLGDFVALYYNRIINDQWKRQKHKTQLVSAAIVEDSVLTIANAYWQQSVTTSGDLSQNALKRILPSDTHAVLDSLIASNELIREGVKLIWRLADFSFYCVAISLLKEYSDRSDREAIEKILSTVHERYKEYACDILVIVFYLIARRTNKSVLQEDIGLTEELDPEEEKLRTGENDNYLSRLSGWIVESEYGYGIVALQILRFLDGESVIDIANLPSSGVLSTNAISFDRVIEYVDSLVESYGFDRIKRTRKSVWYFNHFVDTCKAIEACYQTDSLVALDETGVRLCEVVLVDTKTSIELEAELFEHLGTLPGYLADTGKRLEDWFREEISSIDNVDRLASLLSRLGNYSRNEARSDIADTIAEHMCVSGDMDSWLIEEIDHPIFSVPHFYVRKSMFNVYVGSRRFSAGERVLNSLVKALSAGGREARRNAIFVVHEWYIKDKKKKAERLLILLIQEMQSEADLELVSTIVGVMHVNKLSHRRELAGSRTFLQVMEEEGVVEKIVDALELDLSGVTSIDEILHKAITLRGLIEYIEEVKDYFENLLERIDGSITDDTRKMLVRIQVEEAGDMPEFLNMLESHESVLKLAKFRAEDSAS